MNVGKDGGGKKSKKSKAGPAPFVLLPDPEVSTRHASLDLKHTFSRGSVASTCLTVKDLGSTNGTYVNGRRLEGKKVKVAWIGDKVRFGGSVAVVGS